MSRVQLTANNPDCGQIAVLHPSLVKLRLPVDPVERRRTELGASTKAALSDFQRVIGPPADGVLTPRTLTCLNAELAPTGAQVFDASIRQNLPAMLPSDPGREHAAVSADRAVGRSSGQRGRLHRPRFARSFCRSRVDTAVPRCPARVRVQPADGVYPEVLTLVGDGAANPAEGLTESRLQRADLMRRALQHAVDLEDGSLGHSRQRFPASCAGPDLPAQKLLTFDANWGARSGSRRCVETVWKSALLTSIAQGEQRISNQSASEHEHSGTPWL